MTIITLDLVEVADEWQEAISIINSLCDRPSANVSTEREVRSRCEALCHELGVTPDPGSLRNSSTAVIREDTFTEYAEDYAEEVWGDGVRELSPWVDWDRFADSLRIDYAELEYDGDTYLYR